MDDRLRRQLRRLPQWENEVWQGDSTCLRAWIKSPDQEPFRPWIVLWTNATEDLILSQALKPEQPSLQQIWEGLLSAMQQPAAGQPHRPGEIQVRSPLWAEGLGKYLKPLDICCVLCEDLPALDHILAELEKALGGGDWVPGHLEVPGVTPTSVAQLFQAAADFYRRAPWQYLDDSRPIAVFSAAWSPHPWYAVVMGHGGLTYGLAVHESLELLEKMYAGHLSNREIDPYMTALSLTFGDVTQMSFDDLEALERYGWEVAGPEAYPFLYRIDPGLSVRRPLPQEMDLLEACLRALPPFVEEQGEKLQDPMEKIACEMTVPTASGEMTLRLSTVSIQVRPPSRRSWLRRRRGRGRS